MSGLVEFLLARISDEEETAGYCFDADWRAQLWGGEFRVIDKDGDVVCVLPDDDMANQHIALHDPARVLADCAARRKIVDAAASVQGVAQADHERANGGMLNSTESWRRGWFDALDNVLRFMAEPYSSHPDFDPSWGVSGG